MADGSERWRLDGSITAYPGALLAHTEATTAGGPPTFGVVDPATGTMLWERQRPPGAIGTALGDVVILSHDEVGGQTSGEGFTQEVARVVARVAVNGPPINQVGGHTTTAAGCGH